MYKISYKTYLNDRLKQVDFHGLLTYPLYIQVTYERKTIFFKSYYFELFSKSRFAIEMPDRGVEGPAIELIIEKEREVIRFVIEKLKDGFSLEAFKKLYNHFSTDLCDATEFGFITFLYTFFSDRGLPNVAELFKWGSYNLITFDLVNDFKDVLKKPLYDELIECSLQQAPPYLPLFGFMKETKQWPMLCVTGMEWDTLETVSAFKEYVERQYSKTKPTELIAKVNNWANYC